MSVSKSAIRVALIGAGAVTAFHHVPGLQLDRRARLAAVADVDAALAKRRAAEWNAEFHSADAAAVCIDPRVDAVVIATPNDTHAPLALAAIGAGKHVLCEKPLGLSAEEARQMLDAAQRAGVVHMTAFTYRFAPSMRYLRHLLHGGHLGVPRHFRSQRFLDLPETSWGWRQYRARAGAGDLYDMTTHRLDFAMDLLGPLARVCGAVAQFAPREQTASGQSCPPSEVDDWSALVGLFRSGATGVWEGTTLAKGYGLGGVGHEWAEVNCAEGTAVYRLHDPHHIWLGRTGADLAPQPVPDEFLKPAGSPRDPAAVAPATGFRYDIVWEFITAITEGRPARPSFEDGWQAQVVADAVIESQASGRWIEL